MSRTPQLDRADFVFNANDTHWLANLAAPLEGYPKTHGVDRVPQSLRTRTNVWALTTTGPGSPSGEDGRFTVEELGDTVLSNQSIAVELLRDAVVARCQGVTTVEVDGATVDISEALQPARGLGRRPKPRQRRRARLARIHGGVRRPPPRRQGLPVRGRL
ncbi:MAG: hypothetical protein R3A51_13705 [Nannocystaceae bacterium]